MRDVLEPMKRAFVGKDEVIDLLGVALVSGENLFLLGPPGTAKSALVQDLGRRLEGRAFDYLLTRFTEPSELFGPFDIRKLREGDLVTNTDGMLPEADLVFLDELLNANSAILNSLLTVLNERVFRRGRETRALSTLCVVGASNHLPEDDALGALYDRFLLRVRCDNVPDDRLEDVLAAGWRLELDRSARPTAAIKVPGGPPEQAEASLPSPGNALQPADPHGSDSRGLRRRATPLEDVRALQGLLSKVDLSAARATLVALVRRLRGAGIAVSDRRAVKLQRLAAASALLCGRDAVRRSDLWVVRHVWDAEEQVEVLAALVSDALGDAKADRDDHPRAASRPPDPESLARDLEALEKRFAEPGLPGAERATLRDRLAALAARCPWVADAGHRATLQRRVDALWPRATG